MGAAADQEGVSRERDVKDTASSGCAAPDEVEKWFRNSESIACVSEQVTFNRGSSFQDHFPVGE